MKKQLITLAIFLLLTAGGCKEKNKANPGKEVVRIALVSWRIRG